jgi:hypothetical protein
LGVFLGILFMPIIKVFRSADQAHNKHADESTYENSNDKSDHWSLLKIQIQIVEVF